MFVYWKYLRTEFQFAKNLKRKIYFLKTSKEESLQTEKDTIKNLRLFNIEEEIKDISNGEKPLENFKGNVVYIIGYKKGYRHYEPILKCAMDNKIPVIIFAKPQEIDEKDLAIFDKHIYCDVANTTTRLAIVLLNILRIVNNEKK